MGTKIAVRKAAFTILIAGAVCIVFEFIQWKRYKIMLTYLLLVLFPFPSTYKTKNRKSEGAAHISNLFEK